jgi:hypothetical protein
LEDLNITNIVNNSNPTRENSLAEVQTMQSNLQKKSEVRKKPSLYDSLETSYFGGVGIQPEQGKRALEFKVPVSEGYELVGDTYLSKFPTYEYGRDNAEFAAQSQSTGDKWANGLLKAGNNLLTTVVGNTVGFVVGATNGAIEGSWDAVYDNSFSNAIADYNEKLGYQLPNYVSKDEQNENFFEKLNNANFWANDVAGAFSFTLGTIVSEAIWAYATGGASIASKMGRYGAKVANVGKWGKVALGAEATAVGLARNKGFVQKGIETMYRTGQINMGLAKTLSQTGKILNTGRFLATSSGNEAGIEALHYKREQRENFYDNFERLNGREASQEEIDSFENDLSNSANAVFATNMAILAPSNLAMFGSAFNIASPFRGVSKSMNKSLFGIGVEKTAEGSFRGIQATTKNKVAQVAYAAFKPLATEGIFEEGLQGVTTKTAENWITSTYDPKYNNKTMALSDATYKAFSEQYGTKEGWTEIGIGALVGIGSSVVLGKGKFQEVRDFNKDEQYQQDYVAKGLNQFGENNPLVTDITVRRTMMNAQIQNATERQKQAVDAGNDVEAQLAQQDVLLAEIQFRDSIGENVKDLIQKYSTGLETITQEQWAESGITDINEHKEKVISGYTNLLNSYESARDFADAILGDSRILGTDIQTRHLKDALTYSIINGQNANKAMDSFLQDMGQIIGEDSVKSMSIQAEIQRMGKNIQSRVRNLNKTIAQADLDVKTLSAELQRLQVSKDETKGERLLKVQEKLIQSNERVQELRQQREQLAKEVSQESKRRRGIEGVKIDKTSLDTEFILGSDLENIDGKLQKVEDIIKSYEGVNHEVYYNLLDLKRQYSSAKENFFNYQASVDAIVNGNFKPKFAKAEGLLGRVFNSSAPIDNFTGEYLTNLYDTYKKSMDEQGVLAEVGDSISDEDYEAFKENGEISETVLNDIASKVKAKERLTEREQEIYEANTDQINQATIPNPNKPDLTPQTPLVQTLTETEKLRQEIEKIFEKDYPLLTTDVDELIRDKPTKAEIEEYKVLYDKRATLDLFEQPKFEELQVRMSKWYMAQSLQAGERTIADIVEILSQLETQSEKQDTLDNIDSEVQFADTEMDRDVRAVIREDIGQTIGGSAVAQKKDGKIYMSHIKAKSIIGKLLKEGSTSMVGTPKFDKKGQLVTKVTMQPLTPQLLEKYESEEGTVFLIDDTKFSIGARGVIIFDEVTYEDIKSQLNLHFHNSKTGSWTSSDLYEVLPDGTTRKKDSEFLTNTTADYLYDSEIGASLNLFVDMKTEWNQNLVYQVLEELETEEGITQDTRNKITKTLEITFKNNKGNASTLKTSSSNPVNDNFLYLRKKYADKFIETLETERALLTLPLRIDLEAEVLVKDMYLGTPILQLDFTMTAQELPITERGTQEILTQGYISLEEGLVLANKTMNTDEVSNLYVTNLLSKNPEMKIPVVILQKGKYKFAFPITMNKNSDSRVSSLDGILNSSQTPVEVVKRVNDLLISIGSPTRLSEFNEDILEDIRVELENYTTFVSANDLIQDTYNKEDLKLDATIKVNLENEVISSPKLIFDLDSLTIGNVDTNETDAIKLRASIPQDLEVIRNIVNSEVGIPEQNRFVQAFDNNDVENSGADIMNRKDVNFIKKVFFDANGNKIGIGGKAVEIIGKDKLLKLRDKLILLDFYEKQIKTIKDKVTQSNLNCK